MDTINIDGVVITPLKKIPNKLGDIYHALKSSEETFSQFGEAYFSTINYNEIKGWKKHNIMTLNLIVPVGKIRFVLFDERKNSNTSGQFAEIILSLDNYKRLTIPPGIWLAFNGVGKEQNLLLNIASIEHNPEEADKKDVNEIKYKW